MVNKAKAPQSSAPYIKLFYTVVLILVFIIPLLISLDLFVSSIPFQSFKVDKQSQIVKVSGDAPVRAKTLMSITLLPGFYSETSKTFSQYELQGVTFCKTKSATAVYDVDGNKYPVDYLGMEVIDSPEIKDKFALGAGFGFGLLGLWIIAIVAIWLGCSGWCKCGK